MIKAFIFLLIILLVFLFYSSSKKLGKKSIFLSFLIFLGVFIIFLSAIVFLENDKSDKSYISPRFDGEKIIPGYFDEKD